MRYFLFLIVFGATANLGVAQSLTVSETPAATNIGLHQYMISGHQVSITNGELALAGGTAASSSINNVTAISAALNNETANVFAGNGDDLFSSSFDLEGGDSSARIYARLNGGFIIRENIANFLFYNSMGEVEQSISNSSQSTEGESISELAADPKFKTAVLYNPKIVSGGEEGSRAKLVRNDLTTTDIYYSSNRAIRNVEVSKNGQFMAIVTFSPGTEDIAIVTDRFGNVLSEISFDQNIEGVVLSESGEYVTLRSNGRVGVYSVLNGERVGSSSFRSRLLFAEFIPEDQTIIALTATQSGSLLTNVEVHAINVAARAIQRQNYSSELSMTDQIPLKLERIGSYNYMLSGLNKTLSLRAQF
ncbi:MAG: hypothetical protein WD511_01680 [Balneolaceae bacterium]